MFSKHIQKWSRIRFGECMVAQRCWLVCMMTIQKQRPSSLNLAGSLNRWFAQLMARSPGCVNERVLHTHPCPSPPSQHGHQAGQPPVRAPSGRGRPTPSQNGCRPGGQPPTGRCHPNHQQPHRQFVLLQFHIGVNMWECCWECCWEQSRSTSAASPGPSEEGTPPRAEPGASPRRSPHPTCSHGGASLMAALPSTTLPAAAGEPAAGGDASPPPLPDLPDLVWLQVLRLLGLRDAVALSCTSRRFLALAQTLVGACGGPCWWPLHEVLCTPGIIIVIRLDGLGLSLAVAVMHHCVHRRSAQGPCGATRGRHERSVAGRAVCGGQGPPGIGRCWWSGWRRWRWQQISRRRQPHLLRQVLHARCADHWNRPAGALHALAAACCCCFTAAAPTLCITTRVKPLPIVWAGAPRRPGGGGEGRVPRDGRRPAGLDGRRP